MKALVLERKGELRLRDVDLPLTVGPHDVKIAIENVGVCGSDVHYFTHGRIGPFVVKEPMVLGHEASGRVVEVGAGVEHLKVGDRVCMEPGIPDPTSRASRIGMYNVDPSVVFWATPPVHGCLTPYVVHPASFTYRLPDSVSFAEGAMVHAECGSAGCFVDHCTAEVGTPCDASGSSYGQCGGGQCINVNAANETVEAYCSRSCYSTDSPCPDGFTCKDSLRLRPAWST